jgi:hypothetical protein
MKRVFVVGVLLCVLIACSQPLHVHAGVLVMFETGGQNVPTAIVERGQLITDKQVPVRKGHTFLGYWDKQQGGVQYFEGQGRPVRDFWEADQNLTLYARWQQAESDERSEVLLEHNGGASLNSIVYATAGMLLPEASKPYRDKYAFLGYWSAPKGGEQYYDSDMTSTKKWDGQATTLWAQWKHTNAHTNLLISLALSLGVFIALCAVGTVYLSLRDATVVQPGKNPSAPV